MLVVGNPANTNCLIARANAADVPRERFTSMMRLDHNRAIAQLANRVRLTGRRGHEHDRLGQPLSTQYPDVVHARLNGRPAAEVLDDENWVREDFIPVVQQRGAAIIGARGASSAASAANAAIEHVP